VIVEGFFDCMKLHQYGCRKVVALMGSTMSATQAELIRKHTNGESHIIVMLDEDESGSAGRDDIACRLSKFCFVKVHQFDKSGTQPENLSADEVNQILGGAL
jgi:DNA primase